MKKLLLLLSTVFIIFGLSGQNSMPNGNFEQWTSATFENPQNYPFNSNSSSFFRTNTAFNLTKTTDAFHGNFAVQLATIASATDTVPGYFININPMDSPNNWTGGMPYNQIPTGIRGWYKYNVATADSASIIVTFSHAGTNIGSYIFTLGGIQNTYVSFNFTFNPPLTVTPDSMNFAALSCRISNVSQNPQGLPGSILKIDSVSFTGVTSQPAQFNGDFELWQNMTVNKPAGWYYQGDDQGSGMARTTDNAAGNYALELITFLGNNNNQAGAQAGQISNGYYSNSCNCERGGFPFSNQIDTLAFYYKFAPAHPSDSAMINLSFKKNGSYIGGANVILLASANYQYIEYPFSTFTAPDTVMINIQSSTWQDYALSYIGADLKIDEMHFKSQPLSTGISHESFKDANGISIFPNPSNGLFQVQNFEYGINHIDIFNVLGEKVYALSNLNHQNSVQFNLSNFQKGIYMVKIYDGVKIYSRKIVIQ